jgi:hypothetical protein
MDESTIATKTLDRELEREILFLWDDLSLKARRTLFRAFSALLPADTFMMQTLAAMEAEPLRDLRWMATVGMFDDSPYPDVGWEEGVRIRAAEREQAPYYDEDELSLDEEDV